MSDAPAVYDLASFKAKLKSGEVLPSDVVLRKAYAADSVKAIGKRTYRWTISTGAVDRDRDTIKVEGWQFANFLKGGAPVLWAHQYGGLPVGKAPRVVVEAGALKSDVEFAPAEANPLAENIVRLIEFGAIRSASVGFRPIRSLWNEERMGMDIEEQELLEWSIVPVPANPEALLDAKAAGIDCAAIKSWAEMVLDSIEPGLWVPKAQAQAAFKLLANPQISVSLDQKVLGEAIAKAAQAPPVVATIFKRGRALSAKNEAHIRASHQSASAIAQALGEVLTCCDDPMDEDEPKGVSEAPKPEPKSETVLTLKKAKKPEGLPLTKADVVAAVEAAAQQVAQRAVDRARGRID